MGGRGGRGGREQSQADSAAISLSSGSSSPFQRPGAKGRTRARSVFLSFSFFLALLIGENYGYRVAPSCQSQEKKLASLMEICPVSDGQCVKHSGVIKAGGGAEWVH